MTSANWITEYQHRINDVLPTFLPAKNSRLHDAMHYATCNGGKRLRPLLVYAAGLTFNAELTHLDRLASAIEFMHCYSLVHDDLPAMDNDDLRRGKPTCHKAFDDATAILTGDALQTLAFDIISKPCELPNQLAIINLLAKAAGSQGMAGGQSLDMQAHDGDTTIEQLSHSHLLKTGCLFQAAIRMGGLASTQMTTESLALLDAFAHHFGLAFQIRDDILDVESTNQNLGKTAGKDASQHKATYPALLGLPTAKTLLNQHITDARAIATSIGSAPYFSQLIDLL